LSKATRKSKALEDPGRVHKLRTNARRVEAIAGAVKVLPAARQKTLLRELRGIRRAAGAVRDMDVLTAKAADVTLDDERNCQIQLLHFLGNERRRATRKLQKCLKRGGKEIRTGLQRGERGARHVLKSSGDEEQNAAARALELSGQLRTFATMNRDNLHEFRKKAKQLRYVLQMADPADQRLLTGLREVQDAIGEWHDWEELVAIAKDVLTHGRQCGLIRELQVHADSSFDAALQVASRIRRELLGARGGPAPLRIVKAAARMAA
jgi:CHAD domain-containing protein